MTTPETSSTPESVRPGRRLHGTPGSSPSPADTSRALIRASALRHCTPRDLAELHTAYRRVWGVARAAYVRAGDLARADYRDCRDTTAHDADAQILGSLAESARWHADTIALALADARALLAGEDIRDA